jgi:hypothetical protein
VEEEEAEAERLRSKLAGCVDELTDLGIELKDPLKGLIDFRCMRGGREVYLCWYLGESEVAHWHELHAGFAGRRPLSDDPGPELLPPPMRSRKKT